ncbi:TonB-dependent receptor [Phascolarctobacterium succinatutens]|uniref:TonB-dependent receptor plug domain-containing protein n=1 Tax=Phascolarctobacterium succinatutens TaxID=626940 RepID=UPI00307AF057
MKSNFSKGLLMTALITGSVMWGGTNVFAEELQEFSLDQMVVTATRTEKRDVDIPASTTVITSQQLKDSGSSSIAEVLGKQAGIEYKSFGPLGSSMGTMINEVNIRGISNGTLVLVNGNPISWRGKYNLESIPTESIERIEIVKSGGSVLYGSEAMGGVINIITKKKGSNSVSVGYGNRSHQNYKVNVGDEKFTAGYSLEKMGRVNYRSLSDVNYKKKGETTPNLKGETRTDADDVKKQSVNIGYNFNDNLSLAYNYYESQVNYERFFTDVEKGNASVGDQFNGRLYTTKQNNFQLNYKDDDYKASVYYNITNIESEGPSFYNTTTSSTTCGNKKFSIYHTKERNSTVGADLQRNWDIGEKSQAVLGVDYQHEMYEKSVFSGGSLSRDIWAVFGQWDQKFDDKNSMIFGARETWTTNAFRDQNYNNFSGAVQYIHKLDDDQSLYAAYTESFIMPTYAQMNGASDTAKPNPNLKPQTGKNYELGWKKVSDSHNWKAALYHIDIKDNISATWTSSRAEYTYKNEDFKNTGVELTCEIKDDNGFSYNYGVNYGDPKVKAKTGKTYWDRKFGRWQLNGGITYAKDKLRSSLTGSYLADRVNTPSSTHSSKTKPYFITPLFFCTSLNSTLYSSPSASLTARCTFVLKTVISI